MKKNTKGFTLIELLAVIVILAVIALIATPIIMGVISDAKRNADKDSAYGYVKAVEQAIALQMTETPNMVVASAAQTVVGEFACTACNTSNKISVQYKGTKPSAQSLTYSNDGTFTGTLTFASGVFTINAEGKVTAPAK